MQDVLGNVADFEFFYFDLAKGVPLRIQIQAPVEVTGTALEKAMEQFRQGIQSAFMIENLSEQHDSFIFLREATPMKDQCPSTNKWPETYIDKFE